MTIAVAYAANGAAIVASDGIRTERDCSYRLDWDKTFQFGDWLIGAYAGLLEFSGTSTSEHIRNAIGDNPCSAATCIERIKTYFGDALPRISEREVSAGNRRLDIVLVGKRPITGEPVRGVSFFPGSRTETSSNKRALVIGIPAAHGPIIQAINSKPSLTFAGPKVLSAAAAEWIGLGIQVAGDNPRCIGVSACGGGPFVRCLAT